MKLKFNSELQYQQEAIASVVDLFKGQTPKQANFTVSAYAGQVGLEDSEHGVGNKLELDEEDILHNLQAIQLRNGLKQTKRLKKGQYDFDVEMETGTGKTYVYLRTIFELNKNYGFTKFIIVVPSLPIKEGTFKSLQITNEHFKGLYDNVVYEYFIYDSSKLEQVRNFAVSDHIQIMVINIDAFRKSFTDPTKENKANIIHRANDKLNGMKPIELIAETYPFVIIDEPQSVATTDKAKEAIASLNPLCTLQYSATHVEKHHQIYKLDAVDAYELQLVKQIEVAGFESVDYHNRAYIKLVSVSNKNNKITAKIEMDIQEKGKINRKIVQVSQGTDLYEKSKRREVYEGYIINDIYCEPGNEYIDFTSKEDSIRLGESIGSIDDTAIKMQQIYKTIEEHLNKELKLNHRGIKVLSLFFIDKVANYKYYDENGNACKGKYAEMFEKAYKEIIKNPKYRTLFNDVDIDTEVEKVHGGYFSIDKKAKKAKAEDEVYKDTNGTTSDDEDAYNLIMRDKETLLSFNSKLRFIFSHSALREGWDNPNVFQICTLNETRSEVKKRQEIGRGLRLCVNQEGERVHGFDVNTLTVMANESYESFAEALQREIEEEEGIKFGVIETHTFANLSIKKDNGQHEYLGTEASEKLYDLCKEEAYIDQYGKVTDKFRVSLKHNLVSIPEEFKAYESQIITLAKKICGKLNVKNADHKKEVKLNKQVYLSDDFKVLWNKIKYKTSYSVQFDTERLVEKCIEALQSSLNITTAKIFYKKAKVNIEAGGITTAENSHTPVLATGIREDLPDVITFLQNRTNLTRRTIVDILVKSKTLDLFKKNPQKYMDDVSKIILSKMQLMIIDGIKYTRIGEEEYYAQELFETEEIYGYLNKNMIESTKSVYDHTIYDSDNEQQFAERFESNDSIKLYTKLPDWFKIPTPIGSYNPDWAVVVEQDNMLKLYFVLETKANILAEALRDTEKAKIKCGKKHFEALGNDVTFEEIDNFDKFVEQSFETSIDTVS